MATIMVEQAAIRTAKVEIKALTVGGKQVTMGVFRQLKNEPLIDRRTAKLSGEVWGTVNYFPNCSEDHLHAVWQSGDQLRRSCVYEDPRGEWWGKLMDATEKVARRLLASQVLDGTVGKKLPYGASYDHRGISIPLRGYGGYYDKLHQAIDNYIDYKDTTYHSGTYASSLEYLKELVAGESSEMLSLYLAGRIDEMVDYKRQWSESYRIVAAADQLFIAV